MIEVFSSLDHVAEQEWDSLVRHGSLYSSWRWLRMRESFSSGDSRYLIVRERGRAVAAAIFSSRRDGALHALRVGSSAGHDDELLLAPDGRESHLISLVSALKQFALDLDVGEMIFQSLREDDAFLLRHLGARITPAAEVATIALAGSTTDDYQLQLGRRAVEYRHEVSRFARSGLEVKRHQLSSADPRVHDLFAKTEAKYGNSISAKELEALACHQRDYLDSSSVLFVANDERGPVGVSLAFAYRDTLFARAVGFEYSRLRSAFEYFNLLVYIPVNYMPTAGLKNLHLGIGALEGKTRRGAIVSPRWNVTLPLDR